MSGKITPKLYAVRVGRIPGIYMTWDECKKQVNGFSDAQYKSFMSSEECRSYLGMSSLDKEVTKDSKMTLQVPSLRINKTRLFVDGGHNKITGNEAWGSVVISDNGSTVDMLPLITPHLLNDMVCKDVKLPDGPRRVIVANFGSHLKQQNNGAELLAMVAGLRIAVNAFATSSITEICSDSDLMIKWWSKNLSGKKRVELARNDNEGGNPGDREKLKYIDELQMLRRVYESQGGMIMKIAGSENLADLGFHKG